MSFDSGHIRAVIAERGPVVRVVVAGVSGSAPREAGAAMLVWDGGQDGTIGGGALELEAAEAARDALRRGAGQVVVRPLGPALGQCCGGAVTLVSEVLEGARLEALLASAQRGCVLRPVGGTPDSAPPLGVARRLATLRNGSARPAAELVDGWLVEPLAAPRHHLWLYGAGHVGRSIIATLAPHPDWQVTWVDTHADRFPDRLPDGVAPLVAADPARAVAHAPADAHHLVLTYSHALDLALCHALLEHGFASAGLIGSETKWARFRSRLSALGHRPAAIARITCPIGNPALGKHPQAIAIGVTALLLETTAASTATFRECSA